MMCSMCEAHINEAVRNSLKVKKVSSYCKKGETVILCNDIPDETLIRNILAPTGYVVASYKCEEYKKKGLFK